MVSKAQRSRKRMGRPKVGEVVTVALRNVRPLLGQLVAKGFDVHKVLAEVGIDASLLRVPHARVPHVAIAQILERAEALTGDPYFALGAALSVDFSGFASIGDAVSEYINFQLLTQSATLGEGLSHFMSTYRLVHDTARYETERCNGLVCLRYLPHASSSRLFVEYNLGLLVKALREVGVRAVTPLEVRFAQQPMAAPKEYERLLGTQVRFGASDNAIVLAEADLAVPMRAYLPQMIPALIERAAGLLDGRLSGPTLPDQVRAYLSAESVNRSISTSEQTARALGVSERTLARRLSEAGTSHQALVDELRARLALRYLTEDHLSVERVAELLGYSEARAFQRAFKRWFGSTPKNFRNPASLQRRRV